jgi:2-haloacid dehalogenase
MKIQAVLFDVFGTLLDTSSIAQRGDQLFPGNGLALAQRWREKQLEYTRLRAMGGRYVNFTQLTEDALLVAAEALKLPIDAASRGLLMHEYGRLDTHADVLPALKRMKQSGVTLGVLSNGDAALLEEALHAAELDDYLDLVLSADQVQTYKPARAVYELGPQTLKCAAGDILFVSANAWDAVGAAWAGYQSVWINRTGQPDERLGASIVATGRTLEAASRYLAQRQAE